MQIPLFSNPRQTLAFVDPFNPGTPDGFLPVESFSSLIAERDVWRYVDAPHPRSEGNVIRREELAIIDGRGHIIVKLLMDRTWLRKYEDVCFWFAVRVPMETYLTLLAAFLMLVPGSRNAPDDEDCVEGSVTEENKPPRTLSKSERDAATALAAMIEYEKNPGLSERGLSKILDIPLTTLRSNAAYTRLKDSLRREGKIYLPKGYRTKGGGVEAGYEEEDEED